MNKTTIENAQVILNSFKEGQGKTFDSTTGFKLVDKLNTADGISYNLNGAIVTFTDESHKEAMFQMLFYKEHKDKAHEKVVDTFTYLSSGKYLSMNHRDAASVKVSTEADIISQYPELQVLGFTKLTKLSARSKVYVAFKDNVNLKDQQALNSLEFTFPNMKLLDNLVMAADEETGITKSIGIKVELPEVEDLPEPPASIEVVL